MIRRPLKSVALAAATLCLSAPAFAQSSASLYGLIDMSAGQFQDAGAAKINKAQSGNMATSYIGFRGTEELGGTLKAKFAIESFLRSDTGESGRFGGDVFWARAAWVGLSGDFGTTTLGRTTNQFFVSTLVFNAFTDSFGYSPSIRQVLTPSSVHPQMLAWLGDTGWGNSILYQSPVMGGLSINLQGALGEGTQKGRNVGANALYFNGPFAATVAYQKVQQGISGFTPAIQSLGFDNQTSAQVGASWDFKVVKLMGQYSVVKTQATTDTKSKIYGIGATAPIGAGKLLAQYGNATNDAAGTRPEIVNKTLTVGYDYFLSKRTDIYALVMNDKLTGLSNGNTIALGLKHNF
jgi:predicted porin